MWGELRNIAQFVQGLRPYGLAAYPRALSGLGFVARLRNRGRMGFAHCVRPPPLGARPIAARRGPFGYMPLGARSIAARVSLRNDERRTTNDERRTTSDERRATNDERRATSDERRATSAERRATRRRLFAGDAVGGGAGDQAAEGAAGGGVALARDAAGAGGPPAGFQGVAHGAGHAHRVLGAGDAGVQ